MDYDTLFNMVKSGYDRSDNSWSKGKAFGVATMIAGMRQVGINQELATYALIAGMAWANTLDEEESSPLA